MTTNVLPSGYVEVNYSVITDNGAVLRTIIYAHKNSTSTSTSWTSGEGIYLRNADLRVANDTALPVYQRVNTLTDYDTVGFPMYLRFDGSDDSMATSSINFTSTDEMSVFAGLRKNSDAALGIIAELSSNAETNNGCFLVAVANLGGGVDRLTYGAATRGTTNIYSEAYRSYTSPDTRVMSSLLQNSGSPLITTRLNGVIASANTTVGSTDAGNYGNYPLFIGARNNTSARLNGRIYSLIVRGAATSAADITATETWINGKTKAY